MSLDIIKPLLESGVINEETSQAINEAWETKLNEAKEQGRSELREEFAGRYEHDRTTMVEALDKMVTESLKGEIAEFHSERQAINEDRVKAKQKLSENASKFNDFMVTKLAEEIKERRNDRMIQKEGQNKVEQFIVHALAREIKEFSQDKKAVVEAKVKLVVEGRKQLETLKARFINESAKRMNAAVTSQLKGEIGALKEDIVAARENTFGRKMFGAFAGEFSATHLNEKAETRKLMQALAEKDQKLEEARQMLGQAKKLVEGKERQIRMVNESNLRQKTMEELLSPLNEEKAKVMMSLLESVQTPKLQATFNKYLPAVLNTGSSGKQNTKTRITEATGDKTAKKDEIDMQERDNVIDIKRLAGL